MSLFNDLLRKTVNHSLEMIITKDTRTSYTIMDEANKLIEDSNQLFRITRTRLENKWTSVARKAQDVANERSDVYSLINREIHIKNIPELPSITQVPSGSIFELSINLLFFHFGEYLGIFGTSFRKQVAEDYLTQAKEYRTKVLSTIAEMNQLQSILERLNNHLIEEQEMLKGIKLTYQLRSEEHLIQNQEILHDIATIMLKEVCDQTDKCYSESLKKLHKLWRE